MSFSPESFAAGLAAQLDGASGHYELEAASFALGLAIHVGFFSRGELDIAAEKIGKAYATLFGATIGALCLLRGVGQASDLVGILAQACTVFVSHILGLAFSIGVYRFFFHRLRRFPGPALGRVSSFWMLWQSFRHHQSEKILALHEQYGEYVRVCECHSTTSAHAASKLTSGSRPQQDLYHRSCRDFSHLRRQFSRLEGAFCLHTSSDESKCQP